jgi:nitrogenase molybdenum-cofactor synthesis protein NifE
MSLWVGVKNACFMGLNRRLIAIRPAAVFVYSTCVTALIGDDLGAVCKAATGRWGVPVIPIDAAGFYGSKNFGNRIAGEAMINYVVGGSEPVAPPVDPARPDLRVHDINLIGEYNIAGELWNTLPLFDELGVAATVFPCPAMPGSGKFRPCTALKSTWWCVPAPCSMSPANCKSGSARRGLKAVFIGVSDVSAALRQFAALCSMIPISPNALKP